MSELKEHLFVPYSELQEGDELTDAITIAKSYYLKSDADKVIAELKNENERLKKEASCTFFDDCLRLRQTKRKLCHQKYKRCLAMVEMLEHICPITIRKAKWKGKWYKRWLELADKFKE